MAILPTSDPHIFNVEIGSMDEWHDLVRANHADILARYGSVSVAYRHACDGGLELGGGAAPLFIITFEM